MFSRLQRYSVGQTWSDQVLLSQRTTNPLWNQTPHETTLLLHLAGTSLARNLDSCCSWKSPQRWRCFMSGVFRVGWHCGGNLWTQSNEGPRSRCFTLGLWFHVGFRADLVMFMHVVSCRVYVWDAWCIEIHCFENGETPQVSLQFRPWRGLRKVRCFMSGWGFVKGFAGAQLSEIFHLRPALRRNFLVRNSGVGGWGSFDSYTRHQN